MDIFGLHASVCSTSGDRIKHHNANRDSIFLFSSFAAWAPIKEKPFIFSGSSERPADILVPNFSLGKDLAVDFAITCPLQHKYLLILLSSQDLLAITMWLKLNANLIKEDCKQKVRCTFRLFWRHAEAFLMIRHIFLTN